MYEYATDEGLTRLVRVGPVDVRLGAGRRDLDVMSTPGHPLGDLPAMLLGATRDRVAVALHDIEEAHQTTSSSASTRAASGGHRSSSASRRLPPATSSRCSGSLESNSVTASAKSVGPSFGGRRSAGSPTGSRIAAQARGRTRGSDVVAPERGRQKPTEPPP